MGAELNSIYLKDRGSWRAWLQENHDQLPGIWLIYYKKHTGMPRVAYSDAVEEALCFGWIDSTIQRIDEQTYRQKFTPRKATSTWSEANKKRVAKLIRTGEMQEPGLRLVRLAKESGKWEVPTASRKDYQLAPQLLDLLEADAVAAEKYRKLSPSKRKNFNGWVMSAKMEKTRTKRCHEMIRLLTSDEELGMR